MQTLCLITQQASHEHLMFTYNIQKVGGEKTLSECYIPSVQLRKLDPTVQNVL